MKRISWKLGELENWVICTQVGGVGEKYWCHEQVMGDILSQLLILINLQECHWHLLTQVKESCHEEKVIIRGKIKLGG